MRLFSSKLKSAFPKFFVFRRDGNSLFRAFKWLKMHFLSILFLLQSFEALKEEEGERRINAKRWRQPETSCPLLPWEEGEAVTDRTKFKKKIEEKKATLFCSETDSYFRSTHFFIELKLGFGFIFLKLRKWMKQ